MSKKLRYLTVAQTKARSKTLASAIECSILHWRQNKDLTIEQLKSFKRRLHPPINVRRCALCTYDDLREDFFDPCSLCPLRPRCKEDRSPYLVAWEAYWDFQTDSTQQNYRKWKRAATAMWKALVKLRRYK